MAAQVVAQRAVVLAERLDLRVPHGEVVGDAGDERDVRRALFPVEAVLDLDAVGVDLRHAASLSSYSGVTPARRTCSA